MGKKKDRIETSGGGGLAADNPFGGLEGLNLPDNPTPTQAKPVAENARAKAAKPKETLLLRRLKAGKGGKVVTEISGFRGCPDVRQRLLKRLQGGMGTGGTSKGQVIELQGECREKLKPILEAEGYRVKGI